MTRMWDALGYAMAQDSAWDPMDQDLVWALIGPPPFDAGRFARLPLVDQDWYPFHQSMAHYPSLLPASHDTLASIDRVVVFGVRDKDDLLGRVARGAAMLAPTGRMAVVIDNALGARSVLSTLEKAGLIAVTHSKHHARIALGYWDEHTAALRADWIRRAEPVLRPSDGLWVQAGLHGAREPDRGSLLLRACLSDSLAGDLADFGCGYGLLVHDAPRRFKGVRTITGIDADRRALDCFVRNVDSSVPVSVQWGDVTDLGADLRGRFDTIIMNPPFHAGRMTDPALGNRFIESAARALKKQGRLWMVANRFLPYEETLSRHYATHRQVADREGFKVIEAVGR